MIEQQDTKRRYKHKVIRNAHATANEVQNWSKPKPKPLFESIQYNWFALNYNSIGPSAIHFHGWKNAMQSPYRAARLAWAGISQTRKNKIAKEKKNTAPMQKSAAVWCQCPIKWSPLRLPITFLLEYLYGGNAAFCCCCCILLVLFTFSANTRHKHNINK